MSKRRVKEAATQPPELTGIAQLLSEMPEATLDLHGYTGPQARLRARDFLTTHSRFSAGSVVHVITGKGSGSKGKGVLLELTRDLLEGEAANHVDEYAGMGGSGEVSEAFKVASPNWPTGAHPSAARTAVSP